MSNGSVTVASIRSAKQSRRLHKARKMKLSLRQRLRNWLMEDDFEDIHVNYDVVRDSPTIESEGMRFTVFKASGGYVIETRKYDNRKDESVNSMYVINEDKDLGAELGKIITMESLR